MPGVEPALIAPLQAGQAVLLDLVCEGPKKARRLEPTILAGAFVDDPADSRSDEGFRNILADLGARLVQGRRVKFSQLEEGVEREVVDLRLVLRALRSVVHATLILPTALLGDA